MRIVVAVVAVLVLTATYLTWLARRLDRLHARTDGARASLDAQLLRRAAAVIAIAHVAAAGDVLPAPAADRLAAAAQAASTAGAVDREPAENDLSRALHQTVPLITARDAQLQTVLAELATACSAVVLARRFYNDAVRDTCAIRTRRLVRALQLYGHAPPPAYFDVDDTPPSALATLDPAQPT